VVALALHLRPASIAFIVTPPAHLFRRPPRNHELIGRYRAEVSLWMLDEVVSGGRLAFKPTIDDKGKLIA
jgi:hypothetical protein